MERKNAVVTGASAGIGAALVEELARRGHGVLAVARRADRLAEVADRCGGRASFHAADVTERAAVDAVAAAAVERFGQVHVWVNNVGRGITRQPSELTDEDVDAMMRDNVKTALYGAQAILPHFRDMSAGQLVNVSSMLGRVPFATFRSAYSGAKHFLNAWTAMLREELRESDPGITVSLVSPGVVRTDFGRNALHGGPDSRSFPASQGADEVAGVIADVIEGRTEDVYTLPGARERVLQYYEAHGSNP